MNELKTLMVVGILAGVLAASWVLIFANPIGQAAVGAVTGAIVAIFFPSASPTIVLAVPVAFWLLASFTLFFTMLRLCKKR